MLLWYNLYVKKKTRGFWLKTADFTQFFFVQERQKIPSLRTWNFFIHCESNGISPRSMRVYHQHGNAVLYLITPLGVYQTIFRNDDIQNFVLMICNSCGIDDIQCSALIFCRFYVIIHARRWYLMRKILDKMFANKKLSLIIPMAIALLMYLLFIVFGTSPDKINLMMATPIVSVIGFFGIFLVVFIQVKNSMCPEWFLNIFELMATILFNIYAIIGALSFVISGFHNFNIGICLGFVSYSSISWAHSKRPNK